MSTNKQSKWTLYGSPMSNNEIYKKPSSTQDTPIITYILVGLAALLAIAALIWFFNVMRSNGERAEAETKDRFIVAISKWLEQEDKSLTAESRKKIATCVYDERGDLFHIRTRARNQESARQEGSPVQVMDPKLQEKFIDALEGYVSNGGYLLSAEKEIIDKAITSCKARS